MMKLMSGVCIALLVVFTALAGEREVAAEQAARDWLSHVDAGEYVTSWSNAATLFKKQLTPQEWEKAASDVRKPLGLLRIRQSKAAQHMTTLLGAPDGEYVVLQFDSSFANKSSGAETVTVVLEEGVWRVVGYFIS